MSNLKNLKLIIMFMMAVLMIVSANTLADDLIAGDANGDGGINVSDAVYLINFIFVGGDPPVDVHAADVNDDCTVNVSDAVCIINYVFGVNQNILVIGCIHRETTGICTGFAGSGLIYIDVLGNDLHIMHFNAYYQCCLGYLIEYSFDGNTIVAQEADSADLCDCYCHFDKLESIYYDLPDGEYTVIVLGIEGDTLATEDVVIGAGYGLNGYNSSGCIGYDKLIDPPNIEYSYSNGILNMSHSNARFNCGAYLIVQFEQASDTLRFIEVNISDLFVYCMCYFSVGAEVIGIAPGSYVAEVYGQEPMGEPNILTDRRTILLGQ